MWISFGILFLVLSLLLWPAKKLLSLPFLLAHPFRWFGLVLVVFLAFQGWCLFRGKPVPEASSASVREAAADVLDGVGEAAGTVAGLIRPDSGDRAPEERESAPAEETPSARPDPSPADPPPAEPSRAWRHWFFALFVLLLPFAAAPLVFRTREARSNAASAALLAGLTGADLVCGGLLFRDFFGHAALSVGLALLCVCWNLFAAELVARRA